MDPRGESRALVSILRARPTDVALGGSRLVVVHVAAAQPIRGDAQGRSLWL